MRVLNSSVFLWYITQETHCKIKEGYVSLLDTHTIKITCFMHCLSMFIIFFWYFKMPRPIWAIIKPNCPNTVAISSANQHHVSHPLLKVVYCRSGLSSIRVQRVNSAVSVQSDRIYYVVRRWRGTETALWKSLFPPCQCPSTFRLARGSRSQLTVWRVACWGSLSSGLCQREASPHLRCEQAPWTSTFRPHVSPALGGRESRKRVEWMGSLDVSTHCCLLTDGWNGRGIVAVVRILLFGIFRLGWSRRIKITSQARIPTVFMLRQGLIDLPTVTPQWMHVCEYVSLNTDSHIPPDLSHIVQRQNSLFHGSVFFFPSDGVSAHISYRSFFSPVLHFLHSLSPGRLVGHGRFQNLPFILRSNHANVIF